MKDWAGSIFKGSRSGQIDSSNTDLATKENDSTTGSQMSSQNPFNQINDQKPEWGQPKSLRTIAT